MKRLKTISWRCFIVRGWRSANRRLPIYNAVMDSGNHQRHQQQSFATTQWSVVLKAGHANQPDAKSALASLCQSYWFPLYAYVRRRVKDASEAQDLTQEFFARLIEKDSLAGASPEIGRFRSFLLTSMKNFLANEWNKAHAQKR